MCEPAGKTLDTIRPGSPHVYLDKLLSLSPQLGPAGAGELGGAVRHRLTLQPHAGQDVTLQHLLQLLLVGHQLVQGVHGHLKSADIEIALMLMNIFV